MKSETFLCRAEMPLKAPQWITEWCYLIYDSMIFIWLIRSTCTMGGICPTAYYLVRQEAFFASPHCCLRGHPAVSLSSNYLQQVWPFLPDKATGALMDMMNSPAILSWTRTQRAKTRSKNMWQKHYRMWTNSSFLCVPQKPIFSRKAARWTDTNGMLLQDFSAYWHTFNC